MNISEILKAIILGITEGVTEWLPVSSTGHMILIDEFIKLNVTADFKAVFLVVIQLGAVMSVVFLYRDRLFPFYLKEKKILTDKKILLLWVKIAVSCFPAAVAGIMFDDKFNELFYNYRTVSIMLVLFGILFIIIENVRKGKLPKINSIAEITFQAAFLIGLFQLAAAVFPGTSRSGATILGALTLGVSRTAAAEYTFFLAVPVMLGASALKLFKFATGFGKDEIFILLLASAVAFAVSAAAIRFLTGYVKKHDFKIFGWYRIVLGTAVLAYFSFLA